MFQKRTNKKWGYEVIYSPKALGVVGKVMFLKKGESISFQYHAKKKEVLCLLSGRAILWMENKCGKLDKVFMKLRYGYYIEPRQKHRIRAVRSSVITVVENPGLTNDVLRLTDEEFRSMI